MVLTKSDFNIERLIHDILFISIQSTTIPFSITPISYTPKLQKDIKSIDYKNYIIELTTNFYGITLSHEDIDDKLIRNYIKILLKRFDFDQVNSKSNYEEVLASIKKFLKLKISHQILLMSPKGYFPYIKEPSLTMCLDYLQNPSSSHKDVLTVDSKNKEDCILKLNNKMKLESLINTQLENKNE